MLWAGYGGFVSTRSSSNDEYVGHRAHAMSECWRRSIAFFACISGTSGRQSQEIHLNEPMCRHSYYYLATNYFKPQALAVGVWSLKVVSSFVRDVSTSQQHILMEPVDSCLGLLRYVRAYVLAHSYPEALFLFAGSGHPRISEVRHEDESFRSHMHLTIMRITASFCVEFISVSARSPDEVQETEVRQSVVGSDPWWL